MSALGQKRTWQQVRPMSALPPIADIKLVSVQRSNSGSLAIFSAMRRASSRVSSFIGDSRPDLSSKWMYASGWLVLSCTTKQVDRCWRLCCLSALPHAKSVGLVRYFRDWLDGGREHRYVRFGSLADIAHVRPMAALPPKADIVLRGESRHDGCRRDGVCTPGCIELVDQSL